MLATLHCVVKAALVSSWVDDDAYFALLNNIVWVCP